jgi:two-component system, cell cycle response regulator
MPLHTIPPPTSERARVLLVDADASRLAQVGGLLRDEGHEVDTCPTAVGLVNRVGADAPDVLLLAVPEPDVRWPEVCAELRARDPSRLVPIVLLSSVDTDEATVVRGLECGADDFITAPGRADELKARVRVQLRHRRDREMLQWASAQRSRYRTEALIDPLTGIGNRRAAEDGLAAVLAAGGGFMLMMLDVDHFKRINDTYGHAEGDAVLRQLAAALDGLARRGDVVARYGGEEFLLILRGVRSDQAKRITQRFRRTVETIEFEGTAGVTGITASIGAVTWSGHGVPPGAHDLLQAADEALYAAKHAGRNRVVISDRPPTSEDLAPTRPAGAR